MAENLGTINNAFKRLSISIDDVDKYEILPISEFKILNAIDTIRNRKKRADASSIFEELSKSETCIDKKTVEEAIDEMLKKDIVINKKSSYGDSLRRAAEKSEDNGNNNTKPIIDNENLNQSETENMIKELNKNLDISLCPETPNIHQISETPVIKDNLNHVKSVNEFTRKEDLQLRALEAQLAALKSHLKCEIASINSKIENMSSILDKKLRESNDEIQSMTQMRENIQFLQAELKEKNLFIKTLMETQTAALDSLTNANQRHQKQNFVNSPSKLPECNNTNKFVNRNTILEKENYNNQQQFLRKSEFDVWNKVEYSKNNQQMYRNSKQSSGGDLVLPNKDTISISPNPYQFLDHENIPFNIIDENDSTTNNNIMMNPILNESVQVVKRRPSVVTNNYPENQTVFNRKITPKPTVPGEKSYSEATRNNNRYKSNVIIFSDSIPKGMKIYQLNKRLNNNNRAQLVSFPGDTSKRLLHYLDVHLEDRSTDTVILHIGVNDLLNDSSPESVNRLLDNLTKMIEKCKMYEVKNIFVSSIVYTTKLELSLLESVHVKLTQFCQGKKISIIDNRNIRSKSLYKDGLHLIEDGKNILGNNFVSELNKMYNNNFLAFQSHQILTN